MAEDMERKTGMVFERKKPADPKKSRFRLFRIYDQNNGMLLAKGLAFSLLFGSIPLLLLLISMRSIVYSPEFMTIIQNQVLGFMPPDLQKTVLDLVIGSEGRIASLNLATLFMFLFAVNTLLMDLGAAMATMLGAPSSGMLLHRVIAIPLMAFLLLLFYVAVVLSPFMKVLGQLFQIAPFLTSWGPRLVSVGSYTLVLMGLYYLFSGRKIRLFPTFIIALIAALVWKGLNALGSIVIVQLGSRMLLLGAAASIMAVLFYMRVLADVFMYSSILVQIYAVPEGIAESEAGTDHRWSPKRLWRYITAGIGPKDEAENET